jgi:hypothetical protein
MAGLSDFFGAEQKRKRKLFKGEGYPESAAKRARRKQLLVRVRGVLIERR